jgi:hypothetical protein
MPFRLIAAALLLPTAAFFSAQAADLGAEIVNARTHAGLAARARNLADVHMHLQHAVNCLVGPGGDGFDPKAMNPCANSGAGAIPDATDPARKNLLEAAAERSRAGLAAADVDTARADATDTAALLAALR